ncbi:piggyBac transposable element-derived 4-like protein [Labeo rohita]|uniref:PiggyBac transposable element-derived 4-like protein n=1 Tax=Labeo rohita TaxID=84645 RepID=A0A498N9H5_LABRO|nr:piggyBac transposable element-derived 4-like protein [Labeo rohita]
MEEERSLEGDAELEEELSDEASETEDNLEFDPDYQSTDEEESEDEPEITADTEAAYQSKNKKILWSSITPPQRRGRLPAHRIIKMTPGPTRDEEQGQKKSDKLAPIRNIWDKWVERLPLLYNPGPNVTVDECLVRFRGQCPFKQYMPSKPGKYGIKIWAACDSRSSYAWNMQIYTGKAADGKSEKNQGMRVVLDMTAGLEGHTVTCDNFFTSYALGEELLRRKMTMIGTVRSNKPELPPALLSMKNRLRFSSKFAFTDTHALVSYCPRKNKNVLLMSTLHRDDQVSDKDHKKPEIILDYNHTKGGVDNLDKTESFCNSRKDQET